MSLGGKSSSGFFLKPQEHQITFASSRRTRTFPFPASLQTQLNSDSLKYLRLPLPKVAALQRRKHWSPLQVINIQEKLTLEQHHTPNHESFILVWRSC